MQRFFNVKGRHLHSSLFDNGENKPFEFQTNNLKNCAPNDAIYKDAKKRGTLLVAEEDED